MHAVDRQTEFPSLYRDCIPCSAVKINGCNNDKYILYLHAVWWRCVAAWWHEKEKLGVFVSFVCHALDLELKGELNVDKK